MPGGMNLWGMANYAKEGNGGGGNGYGAQGNGGACGSRIRDCLPPGYYSRMGCRIWPLPFPPTTIGAGATLALPPARAQYPGLPEALVFPGSTASFLFVASFFIATQGQLLAAAAMSAEPFQDTATQNLANYDPVGPGIDAILTVTNTAGVPLVAAPILWCRAVKT